VRFHTVQCITALSIHKHRISLCSMTAACPLLATKLCHARYALEYCAQLASTNTIAASLLHFIHIHNRGDELSRRPAASAPPTLLHMHAGPLHHPPNANTNASNSGSSSSAAAAVQRTFSGHDLLGSSGTFLRPPSRPPSRPLSAPYSLGAAQHHLLHDDSSGSSSRLQLLNTGGNAKVSSRTDINN
jgi:hypothetical protein